MLHFALLLSTTTVMAEPAAPATTPASASAPTPSTIATAPNAPTPAPTPIGPSTPAGEASAGPTTLSPASTSSELPHRQPHFEEEPDQHGQLHHEVETPTRQRPTVRNNSARAVLREGTFMPLTAAARIGDQYGSAFALGGYDSTEHMGATIHSVVEGSLVNRVALRVAMDYRSALDKPTLGVGLRFGVLRQEDHGINLGVIGAFKNRGFSEKSGEVEAGLALSRRWSDFLLQGNAIYGQGVFERERDAEASLGGLYSLGKWVHVGLDARARFDLGEGEEEGEAGGEAEREGKGAAADVIAGPLAALTWGPAAFFVQVAGHAVVEERESEGGEREEGVRGGVLTMAGFAVTY